MTIVNPFFQNENWETAGLGDPRGPGNQEPFGWTLTITPQGQLMPWPRKGAKENGHNVSIEARAGGAGEYVHKRTLPPPSQLPDDELFGKPRALLVIPNTDKIYKGFGGIPHAFTITQMLNETPGTMKQYQLYVLAETPDMPTAPNLDLEPDHFRVLFSVGTQKVESVYADMRDHRTVTGNTRAWNNFIIPSFTFPASGEALLSITCQQNWSGNCDFFLAGVIEQTISTPPGNGGNPPPPEPSSPVLATLAMVELRLLALSKQAMVTSNDVDAMRQQIQSLDFEVAALRALLRALIAG